jgi:hypothetical protein
MANPINFSYTDTSGVDNFLSKSVYGGINNANGIDLRIELHRILYGYGSTRLKGHWINYRRYDTSTTSTLYNDCTKEGVGGPAYVYVDKFYRTRRVPMAKGSDQLMQIKPGLDIGDTYVYYFEYDVVPKIGDDIVEINLDNHAITNPIIGAYPFIERYKVKRVHPYRLENARIEYWIVVAQFDEVNY